MTRELKGFCIIMSCYFLGVAVSQLIGGIITGGILGMLILFTLLQTKVVKEEDIKGICNFVLNNMMVLFVPVTAGLMVSYKALNGQWIGALAALIISTFLVVIIVGAIQQYIGKRWKR